MRFLCGVLAALVLLTGCTSAIPGTATKGPVTDEWRDAVVDAVSKLGTTLGPVGTAMAKEDFPALQTACKALSTYLDTMARTVLPGPDLLVNAALRDGINGYRSVANLCVRLSDQSSPDDLQFLNDTLTGADRRIKDALRLLRVKIPRR